MKNFIKLFALIIMILGFGYSANAQTTTKKTDLILLQDKSEISGIIEEISEDEIKYKKAENPTGPIYTIKKSKIYMIVYSNGEREKFAEASSKTPAATSTAPSSSVMTVPTNSKPDASSKVAEKKPKESQKTQPKKEEVVKEQPTTAFETTSESDNDFFDNGVNFIDLGINIDNLGKTGTPITIIINSYNNLVSKEISKSLFFGINGSVSFASTEAIGPNVPSTSSVASVISLGGRYYMNELLKLDANKYQIYGGATLLNFTTSNTTINNNSTSTSAFSFGFVGRIGGRYSFSRVFGTFAEIGFGQGGSAINAGLSFAIRSKKK